MGLASLFSVFNYVSSFAGLISAYFHGSTSADEVTGPLSGPSADDREPSDFFQGVRGAALNERYKLLVKLGGGAYSVTWLVHRNDG